MDNEKTSAELYQEAVAALSAENKKNMQSVVEQMLEGIQQSETRQAIAHEKSLRDTFAGAALSSLISNGFEYDDKQIGFDVKTAYKFADAMLAERSKQHKYN